MSEEIKPCPFCGNETIYEKDYENLISKKMIVIACDECDAEGPLSFDSETAKYAWNQRPYDFDMPAIVKKVQRMEAAINQAITDCIPLLSWVNDDDTAVEMVEHLSEVLGGALCKQPE